MVSSIAKTLGVGSGLDLGQLVKDLAAASREPKIARLDKKQAETKAQISALGKVRADLDSFANALDSLVTGGSLKTQPQVSNDAVLSATILSGSLSSTFTADVEVTQLARAQTLVSAPIATASAPIGEATLTLSINGTDHTIVIDASNNSVTGLANAINASTSGVTAQLRSESGGTRLILKGPSGAENSFTLSGLDGFDYPAASGGLSLAQAAQDAVVKVDGVAFARPTNSVDDIIPGLSLTLKKAAPGEALSLTASRPTEALRSTIQDFVSAFNDMRKTLANARTSTSSRAVFEVERRLSGLLAQKVTSSAQGPRSLTDLGITTNRDGTVALNNQKLDTALKDWPEAVQAMFNPLRDATHTDVTDPGINGLMQALRRDATASNAGLDALKARLQREVDALDGQRTRTEEREAAYQERLSRNFSGMDTRITALKATQSYLEQQIAQWNRSS